MGSIDILTMVQLRRDIALTSLSNKELLTELFGGVKSESGEPINSNTVFALPAFLNGVRLIASSIARADCIVYKDESKGPDKGHPAYSLLTRKANTFSTYFQFMQALVSSACWSGDGYAYIERDGMGEPIALHNLDSRETYPVVEYTEGRVSNMWYAVGDGANLVPPDDVLHIQNLALHQGVQGLSIVDQLKTVLGLAVANYKYGAIYFKHGAHINKVLKVPGWLTKEQQEQLRQSVAALHQGVQNAHRLAVLMGGAELDSTPVSNEDAQWLESREASLIDIANILGLPATKLGARGSISYGSLEQDNLAVLSDTYDAWFTGIEAELSVKLLRPSEKAKFISFDRDSLFLTDPSYAKAQADKFHAGGLSWEEYRAKLKLPAKRGDKDIYLMPSNLTALLDPTKEEEPQAPPLPQPQEQPQEPQEEPQGEEDTEHTQRAIKLTVAALERIRGRIVKSPKPVRDHEAIIRETLAGVDADMVLQELDNFDEELGAVLPEQRQEVMSKWNIHETAKRLWK